MHTKLVVARYLLGLLHSRSPSFFDTHKPISFSTLSSPVSLLRNRIIPYTGAHTARCLQHYGIPRYSESLFSAPPPVIYSMSKDTLLSTTLCWLGARIMSRSGEQLYVVDKYSEDDPRPLLEIMADPRTSYAGTGSDSAGRELTRTSRLGILSCLGKV